MLSSFRSRSRLVLPVLMAVLALTSCRSRPDRQGQEAALTQTLTELLPDGRIYPNDLSVKQHLFDSHVLVLDRDNNVTALDRKNLEAKWYYSRLGHQLDFPPSVGAVSVAMIADGVLHEVDRWYGNQLHVFPLDFIPSAGAGASDSTAYVPSLAAGAGVKTLTTVNLATGIEGWGLSTRGSILHAPIVGGTAVRPTVYFTSEDGGVFAYPATSAAKSTPVPSWMAGTHGRNVAPPTLFEDLYLVGSDQGDLWAFDRVTGEVAWLSLSGSPITEAAFGSGDQVYYRNANGFHALDRAKGKALWTLPEDAMFIVRRPEAVYVQTDNWVVKALDPMTGEVLRSVRFPRETVFLTNQMDGIFYAVRPDGFLFAVDLPIE